MQAKGKNGQELQEEIIMNLRAITALQEEKIDDQAKDLTVARVQENRPMKTIQGPIPIKKMSQLEIVNRQQLHPEDEYQNLTLELFDAAIELQKFSNVIVA